ncbi:MAG: hypothetical protein ACTHQQ_21325, partial [Solirubrobacteraceae bacterium]
SVSVEGRGAEVNFAAVAHAANVSRDFVSSHTELRAGIERLRVEQRPAVSRLRRKERASDASVRARPRAAVDDNQRLWEENTRLRREVALVHGRVRELELDRRVRA